MKCSASFFSIISALLEVNFSYWFSSLNGSHSRPGPPLLQQNKVWIHLIHKQHLTAILHLHHAVNSPEEQFRFYDLFPNPQFRVFTCNILLGSTYGNTGYILLPYCLYTVYVNTSVIWITFLSVCNLFSKNISHWVLISPKRMLLKPTGWCCEDIPEKTAIPTASLLWVSKISLCTTERGLTLRSEPFCL